MVFLSGGKEKNDVPDQRDVKKERKTETERREGRIYIADGIFEAPIARWSDDRQAIKPMVSRSEVNNKYSKSIRALDLPKSDFNGHSSRPQQW